MLIGPNLFGLFALQALKPPIPAQLMFLVQLNCSHRQQLTIHLNGTDHIGQSIQLREIQLLDFDDLVVGVD